MEKQKKPNIGSYLKEHKLGIFFYLFFVIVASSMTIFMTIISANAIEHITEKMYSEAIRCGIWLLVLISIERVGWYLVGIIYDFTSTKIMSKLNLDLAKQAFKLNSKTFSDHGTGTFVQRIVSDPEKMISSAADVIEVIIELVTSAIIVAYIIFLNKWIGLIFVGILLYGFAIEIVRIKFRRKHRKAVKDEYDKINSLTTEIVKSEKDIKSLGLEEKLSEVSKENYGRYKKASLRHTFVDRNFYSARNIVVEIVGILSMIFGIVLIRRDLLTIAAFMVINSNRGSTGRLIWNVGYVANAFVEIKLCHERMFGLFDEEEFITERFGDVSLEKVKGNIEFKKVGYSFREYEYIKEKKKKKIKKEIKLVSENKVFENLSFKIKRNTTVAFVGKSGSGKSTILNLMSKMYEVDTGEVLIDKVNINDLDKDTLRRTISLVNQFPYIFDMSIKENLLLAKKNATDEEIIKAIEKASLKEFISSLPKGIDTKVGESGIKLSGGQKQRLAIARALLRNSSIIIFDESTSSLDNFAQEEVKRSIDALKGKSTIVIVAHRLSTIKNVDKIFFLDEGKIVDEGTFEELFERNEKFKAMFLAENI